MTGLRVRGRNAWLTPKPGTLGATTGATMLAAGAPNPGTTTTTLTITSQSIGDGQATINWTTALGTDGLNPAGVRYGRNGTDANGTGPWSTDGPLTGSATFTRLLNGTAYTLSVQHIDTVGALIGTAKTVTVTPNGTGTTTPTPTDPLPGGGGVVPSHPPASAKLAAIGLPANRRWWTGGRGDGIDQGEGSFATWRSEAVDGTSTWVDAANGAHWFEGWGITSDTLGHPNAVYDANFPGLLDLAIGGPSNYASAAGGSMDAALRRMFTNVRKHRLAGSTNGKPRPTIIRSCHEHNGTWYPWTVYPGNEGNFLAYNRRARKILDETFPECLFAMCFNGDQNSGASSAAMWDANVWDLVGVDYYNQYPYIGTSHVNGPYEPGKFTSWDDGAYRGTADQPRGIERWRQFAEKRGVPLYIPEWASSVAPHGDDPYFTNLVFPWIKQHAGYGPGQIFYEGWFNIWQGYDSNFQIYVQPGSGGTVKMPRTAAAYRSFYQSI